MSFKFLHYLGDLMTGRYSRLVTIVKQLDKDIKELKKMSTKTEQVIIDAANAMNMFAAGTSAQTEAVKNIIDKYNALAAEHNVQENLDDEIAQFQAGQNAMTMANNNMNEVIATFHDGTTPPIAEPAPMPVPVGTTTAPDAPSVPVDTAAPVEETPVVLAPTETPVEETTGVFDTPPAPVTDGQDVQPETPSAPVEAQTGVSGDSTATVPTESEMPVSTTGFETPVGFPTEATDVQTIETTSTNDSDGF